MTSIPAATRCTSYHVDGSVVLSPQATGVRLSSSHLLVVPVEAYARTDQVAEGLQILLNAIDAVQLHGEQIFSPWLLWLKNELLLAFSPEHSTKVGQCFLEAIDPAQCSQARSWELQATSRLSQVWYQQGKQKRARQRLAYMYGWFGEGCDTADLREPQALLTAWSQKIERAPAQTLRGTDYCSNQTMTAF